MADESDKKHKGILSETLDALKARTSGPVGTFVIVWLILHFGVVIYLLFDASASEREPQAAAKLSAIVELLSHEGWSGLLGIPLACTILLLALQLFLSYWWFWALNLVDNWKARLASARETKFTFFEKVGVRHDEFLVFCGSELAILAEKLNSIANMSASDRFKEDPLTIRTFEQLTREARSSSDRAREFSRILKFSTDESIRGLFYHSVGEKKKLRALSDDQTDSP